MDELKPKFKLIPHPNGTSTLVDLENDQAMHSRIGPELESKWIYADQARVEERLQNGDCVLYDVGLGTGANVCAVLDRIQANSAPPMGRLQIHSFETKIGGLKATLENLSAFPSLLKWRERLESLLLHPKQGHSFSIGETQVEWTLHVGDFYTTFEILPNPDFIFFDFYSPKVVPELWSYERFLELRKKISEHPTLLYTYSAATPVRLHFLAAGFFVGEGPSTGIKGTTTVVSTRLELLVNPLKAEWLKKLETSASIRDETFAPLREKVREHPQFASR